MGIRIRTAEVDVPDDDPFRNDLLGRKESAEVLTQLVDGIEGPCVMAIDAAWGAGKTTFLKMWSQHLRKKKFPVVEFNAWETDHAEDPFVALAAELKEGLKAFGDESLTEKITRAARQLAPRAIPGMSRLVTGALGVPSLIGKEAGTLLASYAEKWLDRYNNDQKSIKIFRDKLQEIANTLYQSKKHPLMVFIDELDRCRPSYAVALLEVAKHLFGADHVVFVLAVNRTQLAHSISALYGSEFDGTGYLRRFFDIDFRLPEPDRTRFIRETRFIRDMLDRIHMLDRIQVREVATTQTSNLQVVVDLLEKFFGLSDLSLRQVGQAIHRLDLVAASLPGRALTVATVALIIRTIDFDRYRQFERGDLSDLKLVDAISEHVSIKDEHFEAFIVMAAKEIKSKSINMKYNPDIKSPLIDRYRKDKGNSQTPPGHVESVIKLVQTDEQPGPYSIDKIGFGFLDAVRRIELLSYERS